MHIYSINNINIDSNFPWNKQIIKKTCSDKNFTIHTIIKHKILTPTHTQH